MDKQEDSQKQKDAELLFLKAQNAHLLQDNKSLNKSIRSLSQSKKDAAAALKKDTDEEIDDDYEDDDFEVPVQDNDEDDINDRALAYKMGQSKVEGEGQKEDDRDEVDS